MNLTLALVESAVPAPAPRKKGEGVKRAEARLKAHRKIWKKTPDRSTYQQRAMKRASRWMLNRGHLPGRPPAHIQIGLVL
jgi:hypothetical protein